MNKVIPSLISLAFGSIVLTGCASLTSPASVHKLAVPPAPAVVSYDASRRGAYILPRDNGLSVCAEPAPDVAYGTVASLAAQVQTPNSTVSGQGQIDYQQSVVQLATQTEALEFLRESMYRVCEEALDNNLSSVQVKDVFDQVLKTSLTLAQAQLTQQQSALAKRLQDPQVREVWTQVINQSGSAPVPTVPPAPTKDPSPASPVTPPAAPTATANQKQRRGLN